MNPDWNGRPSSAPKICAMISVGPDDGLPQPGPSNCHQGGNRSAWLVKTSVTLCTGHDHSYPEAVDRPPISVCASLAFTALMLAGAIYVLAFYLR